jgi:hypothetical protein
MSRLPVQVMDTHVAMTLFDAIDDDDGVGGSLDHEHAVTCSRSHGLAATSLDATTDEIVPLGCLAAVVVFVPASAPGRLSGR